MNPVPGGDRIVLTGVRAFGRHGVLPEEREQGQHFVVDLELVLPLSVAAATDDVVGTVHYGELAERVVAAVERDPVDLIETLADRIAGVALEDERVERVVVTVHKPAAPIPVPFGDVAVRVERVRATEVAPVVIAMGGNLGDTERTLDDAVAALRRLPGLVVTAVSTSHETVAVTTTGPDPTKPRYRNRVLVGRSSLRPHDLLAALLGIEQVFGRTRGERWGDRTLDLDLIVHGDEAVDEPGLTLPHPRAHERAFVLVPWLEADPQARLPGRGSVRHLVAGLEDACPPTWNAPSAPSPSTCGRSESTPSSRRWPAPRTASPGWAPSCSPAWTPTPCRGWPPPRCRRWSPAVRSPSATCPSAPPASTTCCASRAPSRWPTCRATASRGSVRS